MLTTDLGHHEDGSFVVLESRLAALQHEVAKLARRADKTGTAKLGIEVSERFTVALDETRVQARVRVSITGEIPRIAGFRFAARVEHHETGNVVAKAPRFDRPIPTIYRTAIPACEHCGTNRRRNDTFVLYSIEHRSYHQIGRNCLADFLRTADVDGALGMWAFMRKLELLCSGACDGDGGYGSGGFDGYSTRTWLAHTCAAIRLHGWTPKSAATDFRMSTASHASFTAGRCPNGDSAEDWHAGQPIEADFTLADDVAAWVDTLGEREDLNDYLHNVRAACAIGYVTFRNTGIVASVVAAYQRELGLTAARKASANKIHVGTVGKREVWNLTVIRTHTFDTMYGSKTIVSMQDADGNVVVWKAAGVPSLKAGDKVCGKGTVKEHSEYRGTPQTVLSRCAFEVVA